MTICEIEARAKIADFSVAESPYNRAGTIIYNGATQNNITLSFTHPEG
ncbi:MAG: hypothetical protein GX622_08620 [Bacteroidales bacterium]|nr:hypothetical protein [Bacteroidales bacterium]